MPSERRKRKNAQRKLAQHKAKGDDKCSGRKKNGNRCGKDAGWGTTHQGTGKCKHHGGSTPGGKTSAAKEETNGMARLVPISPGQGLETVLHLSAGQLAYVTQKVAALDEEEIITTEGINVWVRLQRSLMYDVAKFAKISADAGIDERLAGAVEQQTNLMGDAIERIVGALNLTAAQRKQLGPAIRQELAVLPGGKTEVLEGTSEEAA